MLNRRKVAMLAAEFWGVMALTLALLAVGKSGVGYSLFLSGGVAFTFIGAAMFLARVSGAHFNPAVTVGLWSSRAVSTVKAASYLVAQFAGGAAAWALYTYLANQSLPSTSTAFDWRIMLAEGIAGMVIVFGVAAALYQKFEGIQAAATIGLAIFIGTLVASLASNGIGNPAIALGVNTWSWAYVAGPIIGGIVGANLYLYLFAPADAVKRVIARKAKPARRKKK